MRSGRNSGSREGEANSSQDEIRKRNRGSGTGTLKVVGLGPGSLQYLAPRALEVLSQAQVIVGYKTYIGLLPPSMVKSKKVISTGMRGEIERCKEAIESAYKGMDTVVVSSGDPGIYGMAGLILEMLAHKGLTDALEVEIIPGIPALCAAAALLGAPLMNDFTCISLSDLLTPWEVIEKRVKAALEGDFVLVLYNPRSKKRYGHLDRVLELVRAAYGPQTPVGVVRNAMRKDQGIHVCRVSQFDTSVVDMLSIVVVGNSTTCIEAGKMITPRGYMNKYGMR